MANEKPSEQHSERRKHTPESVLEKVIQCETEVGQNMDAMRVELQEHKDAFTSLKAEWDLFIKDFAEMLKIFRSARGFFTVLGWIGSGVKWIAALGIAVGTVVAAAKSGFFK